MGEEVKSEVKEHEDNKSQAKGKVVYFCDRCGFNMIEMDCKVQCPNCGNRFDCSDLNIYFD
jgi:rubrerythrin